MKCYHADVAVAGGGPAGVCAAIAAGRLGKRVLLVEQYGSLGGMSTIGLVAPWMTFHENSGKQLVKGIAQEIVDRLMAAGESRGHVLDTMGEAATVTPFNQEYLKALLDEMCEEAGVQILFHTFVMGVEQQNRQIRAVCAANKDGEIRIEADSFIDATGDGDLMAYAGCGYEIGEGNDGRVQPVTMCFHMYNVDFERVRRYMQENPDEFHFRTHFDKLDRAPDCISGFFSLWKKGREEMELDIERERILFFRGSRDDVATVNTTRILGIDGTDPEALTKAEILGRKQVQKVSRLLIKYIPGFENAAVLAVGGAIGVRETRRLLGKYVLTGEDLKQGRMFPDNVAVYGYTIDLHQTDGAGFNQFAVPAYGIPYGVMVPVEIDNLLVAGRCISSTREANSSTRSTPCCMALGQAAGVASGLRGKESFARLDVIALQEKLREQKAYIG